MIGKTTRTILCGAILIAASASCINTRADEAVPPPMPPVMRNVLMWEPGSGGHMVDLEKAKSVNANVINVAAVPHWVGTWGGSLRPLPAFEMGMKNGWKAD